MNIVLTKNFCKMWCYFLNRSHFIIMYLSPNSVITSPEPFKFSSLDMYSTNSVCLKTLYTG